MKKILLFIGIILSVFVSQCYANGGIAHMFLAHETINKLPNPQLRNLLTNNLDAYLVGAYYPDSGYVNGAHYGEDSHWDEFIYAFTDHIKEKYKNPFAENPKLVAFLFGCATHRVSDEITHRIFFPIVGTQDFQGDKDKADRYGDIGIDLMLNIDQSQWSTQPKQWWIPVSDLVAVYKRMGKNYPSKEIVWGTSVLHYAGYGERIIAGPAYPYLELKMPWTAKHYYSWPEGGLIMEELKIADYMLDLWKRLQDRSGDGRKTVAKRSAHPLAPPHPEQMAVSFATLALESGAIVVPTEEKSDGSVEIQEPITKEASKLQALLKQLWDKIT